MNPEQQRIAIAEACGWKVLEPEVKPAITYLWGLREGFIHEENREIIPDYLNDLNAMHEAEKIIPRQLFHVDYWQKGYGRFQQILSSLTITPYSATASHRAEAFLRTIGKWEEAK
tara:strand:+ start:340 stop:684 length:345 start_codon:yes stop_codon:yes gene_type:complete